MCEAGVKGELAHEINLNFIVTNGLAKVPPFYLEVTRNSFLHRERQLVKSLDPNEQCEITLSIKQVSCFHYSLPTSYFFFSSRTWRRIKECPWKKTKVKEYLVTSIET